MLGDLLKHDECPLRVFDEFNSDEDVDRSVCPMEITLGFLDV